jgi:hypothetical protein
MLPVNVSGHLDYTGYVVFPGPGLMRLTTRDSRDVVSTVVIEVPSVSLATYPPTALPSGATPYEGLWLVPVTNEASAVCHASATQLGYRVPCPDVLPYGATMCPNVCIEGGRFLMSSRFPAPIDYVGRNGEVGQGALAIEGYLTSSRTFDCEKVAETEAQFHDYSRGVIEYVVQCQDGSLAWWSDSAYTYTVKLSGHDSRNLGLAKLIALSLIPTGP